MSSSLSALGGFGARNGGGMMFGSLDTGLSSLASSPPLSAGIPQSSTMAAVASSSNTTSSPPPPSLPSSVSAPARESTWRTERVVWPTDPDWEALGGMPWRGSESGKKLAAATAALSNSANGHGKPPVLAIGVSPRARERRLAEDPGLEVVDVTVAPGVFRGPWEFGTTREAERRNNVYYSYGAYGAGVGYGYDAHGQPMYGAYGHAYAPPPPPAMGDGMMPPHAQGMPMGMMGPPPQMMGMNGMGGYGMPAPAPAPAQMRGMHPANGVPMDREGGASSSSSAGGSAVNGNVSVNGGGERRHGEGSDWDVSSPVRDYGYFTGRYGHDERNSYIPRGPRDSEQLPSQQDERPPRDNDYPMGRPRRGSWNGGSYGYEPRGGYRRGRGFRGAYGRGYPRGGFQSQSRPPPPPPPVQHQQQQQQYEQQAPEFTITPPPHFTPLVPEGYYPNPSSYMPSYDYAQTSHHSAPVPTLRTQLSFPIDRLRHDILSQLEFYLSPDNMATDLYLRQQMDSKGWVRIDVLASFKRVQTKTSDLNLVRDVLALSKYAEIRGDWVRSTDGWEKFVLPTAQPSIVEPDPPTPASLLMQADDKADYSPAGDTDDLQEEEEDDVVFVMGREAWSPERPR
ncbi:hypothetical protein R3P38DRAFT_2875552 [Favolaschia claudopus]|uniref:HTH La-type RNA-binding domain-containing protein n=1 Tax=Favolaschia claudopus TaxID=2862362 RepID=A0AAW0D863_9AGAR